MEIKNLKKLLIDKDMSYKQLAELIGKSPSAISSLINKNTISIRYAKKIAAALGVHYKEILDD